MRIRNVFVQNDIARNYDAYYETDFGKNVDFIEKKVFDKIIEDIPKGKMLEAGCGTGHWTEYFAEKGYNITAIDISDLMLRQAESKNIQSKFIKADIECLPFDNETYDTVLSVTMLEFVENPEQALKEIYRVLKKGGYLILGCLNYQSVLGKNKKNDPVFKNARFFTKEDYKLMFSQFQMIRIKEALYLSDDYKITDGTDEMSENGPAFTVILLRKE